MFEIKGEPKNRLERLWDLAPDLQQAKVETETGEEAGDSSETTDVTDAKETKRQIHQQTARRKIEEMIERLDNQDFTRFWP